MSNSLKKARSKKIRKDKQPTIKYEVEDIIGHRDTEHGKEYKIKWKGYSEDDWTYESEEWMRVDIPKLVKQYEESLLVKSNHNSNELHELLEISNWN